MDIITLDFETYYDQDYSLFKMTTEEYVRDPRFQIIGLSVKVNNGETAWLSGEFDAIKNYLHKHYDWVNSAVLAHNTLFDGAILSWLLDIHPRVWLDTLCMARALHGVEVGGSLSKLAELYEIGVKGTEVVDAKGKRLEDFYAVVTGIIWRLLY
jgi:DNA polymerase III alpha subunit (gram-positive type)